MKTLITDGEAISVGVEKPTRVDFRENVLFENSRLKPGRRRGVEYIKIINGYRTECGECF